MGVKPTSVTGNGSLELPEFNEPPENPIALLRRWVDDAKEAGVREPLAVSLATADSLGQVANRTVIVEEIRDSDVVFAFSAGSRKGRDLEDNTFVAVNVYWRETMQQLRIVGRMAALSADESDETFYDRPRAAQATTAASDQSKPLDSEALLRQRAVDLENATGMIDRPDDWFAWALIPDEIEFWHGAVDRLHRRLVYRRDGQLWSAQRLQP